MRALPDRVAARVPQILDQEARRIAAQQAETKAEGPGVADAELPDRRTTTPRGDAMTVSQLEARAKRFGLMLLGPVRDERGRGYVLYDPVREVETGPPWLSPGQRLTLPQVKRALDDLEER